MSCLERGEWVGARRFTPLDPRIEMIPESGCWIWLSYVDVHGYGVSSVPRRFHAPGNKGYAHRLFYESMRAPIPPGMVLHHTCRVRCCVNPDHMQPMTNVENVLEPQSVSNSAINAAKPNCPKCGGEYSVNQYGARTCDPCRRAHARQYQQDRRDRVKGLVS